ncbi:MAG: 3'(2'),5'-bisphosphate nucleotidase CysQ [Spirochaetia bacterium]|nr:3'(2'),5'-bisphosphate nucleotidase CysQ [Spirochaetia bacterium]
MKYNKEIEILSETLDTAGKNLMKFFHSGDYEVQEKSANNPVTEADFTTNKIIIDSIRKHFPEDAILSEEVSKELSRDTMNKQRFSAERVWIIDPLDGTKEFVMGKKEFSVSVGLLDKNEPVLGFIFNPADNHFLCGGKNSGLFLNGKEFNAPLRRNVPVDEMKICISRTEKKGGHFDFLEGIIPDNNIGVIGSVAYKLSLVASGDYDLIISVKPKNEWDIAGGIALFQANEMLLYDENYKIIPLNKEDTISNGLIGGLPENIEKYRALEK